MKGTGKNPALAYNEKVIIICDPSKDEFLYYIKDGRFFAEKDPQGNSLKTKDSVYVLESNTGKITVPNDFKKEFKGLTGIILKIKSRGDRDLVMQHFTEIYKKDYTPNNIINNTANNVNSTNSSKGVDNPKRDTLTKIFGEISQYTILLIASYTILPFLCCCRMYADHVELEDVKQGMVMVCYVEDPNDHVKKFAQFLVCSTPPGKLEVLDPKNGARYITERSWFADKYTGISLKPVDNSLNHYNNTVEEAESLLSYGDLKFDNLRSHMLNSFMDCFNAIWGIDSDDLNPQTNPLMNAFMITVKLNREHYYGTLKQIPLSEICDEILKHKMAFLLLKNKDKSLIEDQVNDSFVYARIMDVNPGTYTLRFNGHDEIFNNKDLSQYYTGYAIFLDDITSDENLGINSDLNPQYNITEEGWKDWMERQFITFLESVTPNSVSEFINEAFIAVIAITGVIAIIKVTAPIGGAIGVAIGSAGGIGGGIIGGVIGCILLPVAVIGGIIGAAYGFYKLKVYLSEKRAGTHRSTIIKDFKKKYGLK